MKNKCVVCGRMYDALRSNQKACSEECRYEYARYRAMINARKNRFEKKDAKKTCDDLAAVAKKARDAGMSYGKYVSTFM